MVLLRRNVSLVALYSLKFTRCSILAVKSLVAHCEICSLLVVEVAHCKKSHQTLCWSCSLQKITHYSLQNSLVTCCRNCQIRSLLVAEIACCKKSFVTRCKICLFLVAEIACCKKSLVTCCKIRSLLVAEIACRKKSLVTCCKIRSLLVAKIHLLLIALLILIATYYVKSLLTRANFS